MKKILEHTPLIVITCLLAFILLQNCRGEEYLDLQRANQIQKIDSLEFLRKKQKDSLERENLALRKIVEDSEKEIATLEKNIAKRKEQSKKDKERIKNLNNIEVAQELNTIYSTDNALATDISVDLRGDLPNRVLETIYEADACQDILTLKDSVILEQDVVIEAKDGEIENLSLMFFAAEKTINEQKTYQKIAEDNIKSLQKESRRKNYFIGAAAILGMALGTQLTK